MVQKKKPDILEEKNFEDIEVEAAASKESSVASTISSSDMMSNLMRIVGPVLAMIGILAILFLGWWLIGGDDDSADSDDQTDTSQQVVDEEPSSEEPEELTDEERALQYVKFEEVSSDEFKITGRVTDVYDDRAFDGNAGIIIEDEYRVDTVFGGGSVDSAEIGQVDDVGLGDWVEIFVTGRKSFSSTASYLLNVFDTTYYVNGIENPITGDEVVGNQSADNDTDDIDKDIDEDTESDNTNTSTSSATGSDDVTITKASIEAGSKLTLGLTYPGCGQHDFGINRVSIKTDGRRVVVLDVVHDANGDSCEKSNESSETFDISDHISEFEGELPYDIEIRGSSEPNSVDFTVG